MLSNPSRNSWRAPGQGVEVLKSGSQSVVSGVLDLRSMPAYAVSASELSANISSRTTVALIAVAHHGLPLMEPRTL